MARINEAGKGEGMTHRTIDFDRSLQQQRSAELLRYITQQIMENDCAPTFREMADSIGVSKGIIWEHIEYLELRGEITTISTSAGHYRPNSIRLNRRVIYFTPDEWLLIQTAWGDCIKEEILKAAEQTRFVVTA